MTYEIKIKGMMCGHCEKAVCRALTSVEGVKDAKADSKTGIAFAYSDVAVNQNVLKTAIENEDYTVLAITVK